MTSLKTSVMSPPAWTTIMKLVLLICILLVLSGVGLTAIGAVLFSVVSKKSKSEENVHIYWTGCLSLLSGFTGILILLKKDRRHQGLKYWCIAAGCCMVIQQIIMVVLSAFNPGSYGTRMNVFDQCRQNKYTNICMCSTDSGVNIDKSGLTQNQIMNRYYTDTSLYGSCKDMAIVKNIYITFMFLNGLYILLVLCSIGIVIKGNIQPIKKKVKVPSQYLQISNTDNKAGAPSESNTYHEDMADDVTAIKSQLRNNELKSVNELHTPLLDQTRTRNTTENTEQPDSLGNNSTFEVPVESDEFRSTMETGENLVNDRQELGETVKIKQKYKYDVAADYDTAHTPTFKPGYPQVSDRLGSSLGSLASRESKVSSDSGGRRRRSRSKDSRRSSHSKNKEPSATASISVSRFSTPISMAKQNEYVVDNGDIIPPLPPRTPTPGNTPNTSPTHKQCNKYKHTTNIPVNEELNLSPQNYIPPRPPKGKHLSTLQSSPYENKSSNTLLVYDGEMNRPTSNDSRSTNPVKSNRDRPSRIDLHQPSVLQGLPINIHSEPHGGARPKTNMGSCISPRRHGVKSQQCSKTSDTQPRQQRLHKEYTTESVRPRIPSDEEAPPPYTEFDPSCMHRVDTIQEASVQDSHPVIISQLGSSDERGLAHATIQLPSQNGAYSIPSTNQRTPNAHQHHLGLSISTCSTSNQRTIDLSGPVDDHRTMLPSDNTSKLAPLQSDITQHASNKQPHIVSTPPPGTQPQPSSEVDQRRKLRMQDIL